MKGVRQPTSRRILPDLERRLTTARRRSFLGRVASALAWLLVALACGVLYLRFTPEVHANPSTWTLLAGLWIAGAGVAMWVAWRSTPDLQQFARAADRQYSFMQILSTAREVAGSQPRSGVERLVQANLRRQAEEAGKSIDPRRLAPVRSRGRIVLPLTMATTLALSATLVPEGAFDVGHGPARDVANAAAVEGAEGRLADELERLAEAVAAEADRLDDPYLGALSAASNDLATRLHTSGEAAGVASRELDALLGQIEVALDLPPDNSREPAAASVPDAVETMPHPREQGVPAEREGDVAMWEATMERVTGIAETLEEARALRDRSIYASSYSDPEVVEAILERRGITADLRGDVAGAPAGAARDSSDAAGDAAGTGSHALTAEDSGERPAFEGVDDVKLPESQLSATGPRVAALADELPDATGGIMQSEVDAAAATVMATAAAGAASQGAAAAEPREAGGWRRGGLAPEARDLASLLFAPNAGEGAP